MSKMLRLANVGLLLFLVLSLPRSTPPVSAAHSKVGFYASPPMTVREVYRRAQQSLTRTGMIYYALLHEDALDGPLHLTTLREMWLDGEHQVARERLRSTYTFTDPQSGKTQTTHQQGSTITTSQGVYSRSSPPSRLQVSKPQRCYGAGLVAADVLLGCPGPTTTSRATVRVGRYAGHPAVVLVRKGVQSGEDQNRIFTSRLYLDSTSFLPIASVTTGTLDMGKKYRLHETTTYSNTFISTSSVAANFFAPASIGYHGPEDLTNRDLAAVPPSFALYWLGVRFHAPPSLPDLIANRAVPSPVGGDFLLELYYTLATDPYGFPALFIEETSSQRDRFPLPPGPCFARKKVQLAGGSAVIVTSAHPAGKSCPTHDMVMALGRLGETRILIQAPNCCGPHGEKIVNPYDTGAGMEAVVRALQRRVPPPR